VGKLKRSTRNIRWIEQHCRVPEGRDVGKPVKMRQWQREWLRAIYDEPTRRAIISIGRKNGKSTFTACLLLLHLVGPEARINAQLYSAAQSRDQAALVFSLAAKMVRQSPDLSAFITVVDSSKKLLCDELGTVYRALSAEASTAYGLSPAFVIHDELGQVRGPRSELYEALETAVGAQEAPLSVVISTQAATDADLLSILIDDAKGGGDPETKLFFYSAPEDADPFSREAQKAANPGLGDVLNEKAVREQAESARRMPSMEASYRNLVLNQRVEASNPFVTASVWKSNGGEPSEEWDDLPVYAGLDLSSTRDLTAFVLCAQNGEQIDVHSYFWLPEEGLSEKAHQDRVPYDQWRSSGHLLTTPGNAVEYSHVARFIVDTVREHNIQRIAFDRWNLKHLRPWLREAGMDDEEVEELFVEFGQGFKDMSPALRDLEASLLNARLRHGSHPVLNMCAANATVKTDEAGGRKLDKKRSSGRIDGLVALAMAHGVMPMNGGEAATSPWEDPEFSIAGA
jgi:phage terminase large subunit-like protein